MISNFLRFALRTLLIFKFRVEYTFFKSNFSNRTFAAKENQIDFTTKRKSSPGKRCENRNRERFSLLSIRYDVWRYNFKKKIIIKYFTYLYCPFKLVGRMYLASPLGKNNKSGLSPDAWNRSKDKKKTKKKGWQKQRTLCHYPSDAEIRIVFLFFLFFLEFGTPPVHEFPPHWF